MVGPASGERSLLEGASSSSSSSSEGLLLLEVFLSFSAIL